MAIALFNHVTEYASLCAWVTYSKLLQVPHLIRSKVEYGKLLRVFRPEPKGTPPLVGVRYGCLSLA
jgi:hypothetical protein